MEGVVGPVLEQRQPAHGRGGRGQVQGVRQEGGGDPGGGAAHSQRDGGG